MGSIILNCLTNNLNKDLLTLKEIVTDFSNEESIQELGKHLLSKECTQKHTDIILNMLEKVLNSKHYRKQLNFLSVFTIGWSRISQEKKVELLKIGLKSNNQQLQLGSCFILGQISKGEDILNLIDFLDDESDTVQAWVSHSLLWHGGDFLIPHLISHTQINKPNFKSNIIEILTKMNTKNSRSALEKMTTENE